MTLTKKQQRQVEGALAELKEGMAFLMQPDILLCRKTSTASTTLHFSNAQGEHCYSFNKECGSKFQILQNGIRSLENFINPPKVEVEL